MVESPLGCPSGKRVTGRGKPPAGGNFCSSCATKKNIAMCFQQKFILRKGRVCRSPFSGIVSSSSQFFSDFICVSKELVVRCWLLLVSMSKMYYKMHVNTLSAFLKLIFLESNCMTVTILCIIERVICYSLFTACLQGKKKCLVNS